MAQAAFDRGEVPVGAIVVGGDCVVLARASNRVEKLGCQLGHAEVLAIKRACKKIGNWRLDCCWLFVTLQPCMMCLGLASLSRFAGVCYGVESNLFGIKLPKENLGSAYKELEVVAGFCEQESATMLKKFFILARKSSKLKEKKS